VTAKILSISPVTLEEFAFQNLFKEIAVRVSVEIFVACFGVLWVFCLNTPRCL
jgi:hypothetical protein